MNIPDINYEIIRKLHPYYNRGFCSISKFNSQVCKEAIYELLHIWAYPQLSIINIRTKYPNIDYNDVVSICLLYNPIPESLLYYDPYSCFYYACLRKQTSAADYILLGDGYLYDDSILWICYRFLRLDVLEIILNFDSFAENDPEENSLVSPEDISKVRMFANMVRLKLGMESIYDIDNDAVLGIMDRALLFDNEELIELFVLSRVVSSINSYFSYLTGSPRPNDPDEARTYYFVNSVASNVPRDDILRIVNKYIPDTNVPFVNYIRDGSFALGVGVLGPVALSKYLNYIEACIPISDRGLYYLTSGLIGEYRSWLQNGYTIKKINGKYYGINPFGDLTLDANLAGMLRIDFDDVNAYPVNSIYRRYDC